MNKLLKEIEGSDYEKGLVRRFWNPEDEKMPTLGIVCNQDQAMLIKRLVGSLTYSERKEKGFTEKQWAELKRMYHTI